MGVPWEEIWLQVIIVDIVYLFDLEVVLVLNEGVYLIFDVQLVVEQAKYPSTLSTWFEMLLEEVRVGVVKNSLQMLIVTS